MDRKEAAFVDLNQPTQHLPSVHDALTPRAVLCGVVIGTAVCFANMYFGLVGGSANAMPMSSALVGFAIFRCIRHRLSKHLTPYEATIIEVVGLTVGLSPFPAGLTSIVPALEYLTGSIKFSYFQLVAWATATCALGIMVAPPFRELFLLRERLRFPSATATGTLIGVLFGSKTAIDRANRVEKDVPRARYLKADTEIIISDTEYSAKNDADQETLNGEALDLSPESIDRAIRLLICSLIGSLVVSMFLYIRPALKNIPLFGSLAQTWLWSYDLSPAYLGFGMIVGPQVHAWMIVGAVIGWGLLSPLAMYKGWTTGPVDGWDEGSRGWLLWICMGLVLGDTIVGLCWALFKPLIMTAKELLTSMGANRVQVVSAGELDPLLSGHLDDHQRDVQPKLLADENDDEWPIQSLVTAKSLVRISVILFVLYLMASLGVFRSLVPAQGAIISLILVPFGGFIAMRALGETENPGVLAIGRAVQLIMGFAIPSSFPHHFAANMLLSGVVESGSTLASLHMAELKVAYLTQTPPKAVLYGQLIGSFIGALISTFVYRIYTSVKTIPSDEFSIPDSHMYIVVTKLIYEQGLPPGVFSFAIAAFVIGASFGVLRIMGTNRSWQRFVPSGMAMSLGMYIVPTITLPRAAGSMIFLLCRDTFNIPTFVLICSATGLIFGQGIFSVVALIFDGMRVFQV